MEFLKRLPLLCLIAGLAIKGLLVLAWRISRASELYSLLTNYDPGAFAFAEKGVALLFDPRRIAPTPSESIAFEFLLVLGFGLECMIVGFLCQMFRRSKRVVPVEKQVPGR